MKTRTMREGIAGLCLGMLGIVAVACGGMDGDLTANGEQSLVGDAQVGDFGSAVCDSLFGGDELVSQDDLLDYQCTVCTFGRLCGFDAEEQAKACALCPDVDAVQEEEEENSEGYPDRAVMSGVPRYYQTDLDDYLPGDQCGGNTFWSGCGPVAGATILAWWDRRGFDDLVADGDVTADGLPEQAIFDLGQAQYMDRLSFCSGGTAVDPYMFLGGLRDFMDDYYVGTDFVVTKYKITANGSGQTCFKKKVAGQSEQSCNTNMELLRHIVKTQVNKAQPMVLLLRSDGDQNANETFKVANHYVTVVGYDHRGSDLELIVQYNHGDGYQNHYTGTTTPIVLGDRTRTSAAIKYNLYTIEPGAAVGSGYQNECQGLLTNGTTYHDSILDGVNFTSFRPDCDVWDGFSWRSTDELYHQDDICFVARWY